jgi:hypothetical protein
MKYSQLLGILAALALAIACFMPWTYYPDLKTHFTGFFSEQNIYGKPGKFILFMSVVALVFFAMNKVWAKRLNWLVCGLLAAFAFRTYTVYTSCYRGICPTKELAVYIVLIAPIVMLVVAFMPRLNTPEPKQPTKP